MQLSAAEKLAFDQALHQACQFIGATAPNPPVGAAGLDSQGNILSVQAHEKAGTPHAEAKIIEDCRKRGILSGLHTLVVTLEPCNHFGRTPPCTQAILNVAAETGGSGVRRVIYGVSDPNPKVAGAGALALKKGGLEVLALGEPDHSDPTEQALQEALKARCRELIRTFSHWVLTGRPWVTVKTAHLPDGGMIPPPGQKTFTSAESLRLAHELRKRADAVLTGSGTVLADNPHFTVRLVPDHPSKIRWLVVMDRRGRIPESWLKEAEKRGFKPTRANNLASALTELGAQGVLEVLVEAGPTLSAEVLRPNGCLWDQHVVITRGNPDQVEIRFRKAEEVPQAQ